MPPLITREEALALGRLEDRGAIGELVERAWNVRRERFGDATDMCSLVNAKSGGCAEDCGFCAQSKYAEADTPMHAMMSPEQILEHARASEAAVSTLWWTRCTPASASARARAGDMWPIDTQRFRFVWVATSLAPSSTFSKSRFESP